MGGQIALKWCLGKAAHHKTRNLFHMTRNVFTSAELNIITSQGITEVENSPSVLAVMWVFPLFSVLLRPSNVKGGSVKVIITSGASDSNIHFILCEWLDLALLEAALCETEV